MRYGVFLMKDGPKNIPVKDPDINVDMINDYSNPYFYTTPVKETAAICGYPYSVTPTGMACALSIHPETLYTCPTLPCCPYTSSYIPSNVCNADQFKADFLQSSPSGIEADIDETLPAKYQEPEENFISIDELQDNPTLLKMIIPDKAAAERIQQQMRREREMRRREVLRKQQCFVQSIKEESAEDDVLVSENIIVGDSQFIIKEVSPKTLETPTATKTQVDTSPEYAQVKIKTEEDCAYVGDSDEEFDESEEGVELNWVDLEEHDKREELECSYCGKTLCSSYNLKRHMATHTNVRPYGCDICLKAFREFSDLTKHRRSHRLHPDYKCLICRKNRLSGRDSVKCQSCSKKRVSPYGDVCIEEVVTIDEVGEKRYTCPDCNRTFRTRHNLLRHYMIHTGAKPYPCDFCDKAFREVSSMKKHMLTHSRMKLFKCLGCNREYNDYQAFVRHKNSFHGEDWSGSGRRKDGDSENEEECLLQCNDCEKQFSDVSLYKKHLRIHSRYSTYQCYICKMNFKKCEKLNSHMVTHSIDTSDCE